MSTPDKEGDDIVAQLRETAKQTLALAPQYIPHSLYTLAADEIERLRTQQEGRRLTPEQRDRLTLFVNQRCVFAGLIVQQELWGIVEAWLSPLPANDAVVAAAREVLRIEDWADRITRDDDAEREGFDAQHRAAWKALRAALSAPVAQTADAYAGQRAGRWSGSRLDRL